MRPTGEERTAGRAPATLAVLLCALALLLACRRQEPAHGLIVEGVRPKWGGDQAGVRPGDVLLRWQRRPAGQVVAAGSLRRWTDLETAELTQWHRQGVSLQVRRAGKSRWLRLPARQWLIAARPPLPKAERALCERAVQDVEAGRVTTGRHGFERLATRLPSADRGWAWRRLGDLLWERHDFAGAAEARGRAAAMTTGAARVHLQIWQSTALTEQGLFREAAAALAPALVWCRQQRSAETLTALVLYHRGSNLDRAGELRAAEEELRESLSLLRRHDPTSAIAADVHNRLGKLALEARDLAGAEASFRKVAQGRAWKGFPGWFNLAEVAELRGDLARSEAYFERAAAEYRRWFSGEKDAIVWGRMGQVRLRQGDLAGARAAFDRQCEWIAQQRPGHPRLALCQLGLGEVALRGGDLATARRWGEAALERSRGSQGGSVPEAQSLELLGETALVGGNPSAAARRLRPAVNLRRAVSPGSLELANALGLLARAERLSGQPATALALLSEAVAAAERQASRLGGGELSALPFHARAAWIYREQVELLAAASQTEQAFVALERSRAQALSSMLAESGRLAALTPQQRQLARSIDAAYTRLAKLPPEAEASREARHQLERLLGQWESITPAAQRPGPSSPADLRAIQAALPPRSLLLAFSLGAERSLLFSLPAEGPLRAHVVAASADGLAAQVAELRRLVTTGGRRSAAAASGVAAELSRRLLGSAAAEIAAAERLVVVPDGPLHALPFALLPDPRRAAATLVEGHPLQVVSSARVFADLRARPAPPRPWRLLVLADPRLPAQHTDASPMPPLAGARREAARLARHFPGTSVLAGGAATQAALWREAARADLIHLATHAVLDERLPLASALVLSSEDGDSGWLHAWEIAQGPRLRAELVTLAACETARGQTLPGEGLLGLTWALQRRGAKAVLGSLWRVDDEVTGLLMQRFYGYLAAGRSKTEALRTAQLDLRRQPQRLADGRRRDTRHPRHWAGFVLIGE